MPKRSSGTLLRSLYTGEHVDLNGIAVREWLATWLDAVAPTE